MTLDGKTFEEVLVAPEEVMPDPEQKRLMQEHADNLRALLDQTPQNGEEFEEKTAAVVAKLVMVMPGERKSDYAEDVRTEIYLAVLDDVPWWAVDEAAMKWYRHECGTDGRGREHDYKWAPDPGTLRQIAMQVFFAFKARITQMERGLSARKYIDCTKQLEDGRKAWRGLIKTWKDIPADLTFEQAKEIGSE